MKNRFIQLLGLVIWMSSPMASAQTAAPAVAQVPGAKATATPPVPAPVVPPPSTPATAPNPNASPLSQGAIAPVAPVAPDANADNADVGDEYLINVGDVLEVQVVGLDTVPRKARVDASGVITLPLVGSLAVAGRAPRQVEVIVADMLRVNYMQDPQVSVFVQESVSQRFSIEGAVRQPNLFPLKGRMTLLQALAMSGGATKVADMSQVRVLRGTGPNKQNLIFDADKIREGQLPDPPIFGNDVIIVQASGAKSVFYETLDTIRGIVSFGSVR